jgi:hypothetical protein
MHNAHIAKEKAAKSAKQFLISTLALFVRIGELMDSSYQKVQANRPSGFSEATSEDVRLGILRHVVSSVRSWLQLRAWKFGWRWPKAYALLLEIYRILPRIRFALSTLWVDQDRELCPGLACHLDRLECQHPECIRTHARIRGIREQEKLIPWIGRFEVYLFFRGWKAAERFFAYSSCTERRQENSPSQPSVIVNTQEVLAPSRCDQLTPLPSRE